MMISCNRVREIVKHKTSLRMQIIRFQHDTPPLHGKCHLKFPFWFFDSVPYNPSVLCINQRLCNGRQKYLPNTLNLEITLASLLGFHYFLQNLGSQPAIDSDLGVQPSLYYSSFLCCEVWHTFSQAHTLSDQLSPLEGFRWRLTFTPLAGPRRTSPDTTCWPGSTTVFRSALVLDRTRTKHIVFINTYWNIFLLNSDQVCQNRGAVHWGCLLPVHGHALPGKHSDQKGDCHPTLL